MKRTHNADATLCQLRDKYLAAPNCGPALTVSAKGEVQDGISVIAGFRSRSSAYRQLRMAGFLPTRLGWFVYEKANQINSSIQEVANGNH